MDTPTTYGDCQSARLGTPENRCPFSECRHHIAEGTTFSCSLAFVDAHPGGADLSAIGDVLGVCRERIRQVEWKALRRAERSRAGKFVLTYHIAPTGELPSKPEIAAYAKPTAVRRSLRTVERDREMRLALCGGVK